MIVAWQFIAWKPALTNPVPEGQDEGSLARSAWNRPLHGFRPGETV